jgi:hypothetical protein
MFSKIVIARFLYLSKPIDKMYIIILDECEIIHSNIMRYDAKQSSTGTLRIYIHKICRKKDILISLLSYILRILIYFAYNRIE